MAVYKNKEEMFKHRAERFKEEVSRYEKRGNLSKAEWAKEQVKHNESQAEKYKGQEGW